MRLCVAASSSASALGVPSRTPASRSAWRFHRNRVAWQIPVSIAIAATGSPDRSRGNELPADRSQVHTGHVTA